MSFLGLQIWGNKQDITLEGHHFICFFDVNLKNFFSFTVFFLFSIYLFLAVLGLCCFARLSVVAASRGFHCTAWLPPCGGFSLQSTGSSSLASLLGTGFSSCGHGPRVQKLSGSWNLPRPGLIRIPCIGRWILKSTRPPGKSQCGLF